MYCNVLVRKTVEYMHMLQGYTPQNQQKKEYIKFKTHPVYARKALGRLLSYAVVVSRK